ncbi:hypothetical protein VFPPC_16634 [Pochonia chlamydosporia 170]|uniref:Uncharacterized protein n=1 Tax=Pochonia chlamydosporia 170 TaxID=1380566 RepID=A0A179FB21_METCM|nr:hypothetical protein VFPPC_16634 [Pochonia chlamydosporia 170]OAQ62273.1 hypothetical protein VFPPC_16634 [Pochonia chlamydosporia 170]
MDVSLSSISSNIEPPRQEDNSIRARHSGQNHMHVLIAARDQCTDSRPVFLKESQMPQGIHIQPNVLRLPKSAQQWTPGPV